MGSLVLFLFFFIVNFSFWSRYWEGVLEEATLLEPGGSILGPEPVKSELRGGVGGKERFRFQGNSRVTTLRALPPQGWDERGGKSQVSVWLSLLTTRWPCQDARHLQSVVSSSVKVSARLCREEKREGDRVWERTFKDSVSRMVIIRNKIYLQIMCLSFTSLWLSSEDTSYRKPSQSTPIPFRHP